MNAAKSEPRPARVEVTLAVGIENESNFYAGFTENMSECGVFVATYALLRVGTKIDLSITLPNGAEIRAIGTVRWLRQYSESNGTSAGMGIRFDRISSRDAALVQEFTESRAPMFFDDEAVGEHVSAI
jgi:uncharacterized protein (TIGR02266 family)